MLIINDAPFFYKRTTVSSPKRVVFFHVLSGIFNNRYQQFVGFLQIPIVQNAKQSKTVELRIPETLFAAFRVR